MSRMLCFALALGLLGAVNAQAQSYGNCPSNDSSCQAKYALYDAYLTQMGLGVPLFALSTLYQDVLAPHFPNADLSQVRFGFSNRQPAGNATCDCDKIYFNDATIVEAMRLGLVATSGSIHWMLHELRHFEQCREVGSREAFARLWWEHLSETELHTLITTGGWAQVHDQMVMEQDADSRADQVLADLEACCIQPSTGLIVRPLQVTPMTFSTSTPQVNQGLTVSVEASEGAAPYTFEWSWKRPGSMTFQPLSASPGLPNQVVLALTEIGAYELMVRVLQDNGSPALAPYEEIRSFNVIGPTVSELLIIPDEVEGGSAVPAQVTLIHLPPNQVTSVQLFSNHAAAQVPTPFTVTANSYGVATATFTIATVPVLATQAATIEARIGTSARTATLTITRPVLRPRVGSIVANRMDLRSNELFEVLLQLEYPAPGPITVSLASSDPRAVSVPRNVRFEKGEQEKVLSLRTASSIARPTSVTLTAHAGKDRDGEVKTSLRISPNASRRGN